MSPNGFHNKPFDEGTLTKLQIFELYAREWLPVFLSSEKPSRSEVHLADFFAGPGTDSKGVLGSPLRLLNQLKACQGLAGWPHVSVHAHFFDKSPKKIKQLEANIDRYGLRLKELALDTSPTFSTRGVYDPGRRFQWTS
jgi:three-Cys-motif partner protein